MSKHKWEPERPYCPACGEDKRSWERNGNNCKECSAELQADWPSQYYYKHLAKESVAFGVFGAFLFGPLLIGTGLIVRGLMSTRPLVTVETTTIEVPTLTGVLFNAGNWFVIGLFVWLIVLAMYVGPRP